MKLFELKKWLLIYVSCCNINSAACSCACLDNGAIVNKNAYKKSLDPPLIQVEGS